MSKKFLPLAGIAVVLAIVSYLVLSFLFPHKKEVLVDTTIKSEEVFGAALDESGAEATATTAEPSEFGTTPAPIAADEPAEPTSEPVAASEPIPEAASEVPVETAADVSTTPEAPTLPVTETTDEIVVESLPAETPAEETASASEPTPESAEPAPSQSAPTATATPASGLSREQLAKIVAEAAAQAAAETAKTIVEQAARDAANR